MSSSCYATPSAMRILIKTSFFLLLTGLALVVGCATSSSGPHGAPAGFTALFNGTDLAGWRGGDTYDHRKWLALPEAERNTRKEEWTTDMRKHWRVENRELVNDGHGKYATTER